MVPEEPDERPVAALDREEALEERPDLSALPSRDPEPPHEGVRGPPSRMT
jgi:hypothetical protein